MNRNDELSGTLVLVHPDLTYDPENRKNQIGIISSAEIENDNVMVSFGKDGQGLFSTDALYVLKKGHEISANAVRDALEMDTKDFRDILQVGLWSDSQLTKEKRQAIELAKANPKVLEYSMATLEDELGLKQEYSVSR
ncbi:MAG: hypothetical protein JST19_09810 [Bacteroidetes bacterium]|nr:hypothetical protein [Bacteroidota bacterium]